MKWLKGKSIFAFGKLFNICSLFFELVMWVKAIVEPDQTMRTAKIVTMDDRLLIEVPDTLA